MSGQSGLISIIPQPVRESFKDLYSGICQPLEDLTSWLTKTIEPHIIASVKNKSGKDESETTIGITVSTLLVTISVACLPIMTVQQEDLPLPREVFGVLGLFSLLTAALTIDSILDDRGYKFGYRLLSLFNGGYTLFCLAISGINVGTVWLYRTQIVKESPLSYPLIVLSALSTLVIFFKLMSDDEDHMFGPLLPILYIAVLSIQKEGWDFPAYIWVGVVCVVASAFTFLRLLGTKVHDIKERASKQVAMVPLLTRELGLPGIDVKSFEVRDDKLILDVETDGKSSICCHCGTLSHHRHQSQEYRVRDLSISHYRKTWLKGNRRQFQCVVRCSPLSQSLHFAGRDQTVQYTERYVEWVVQQVADSDIATAARDQDLSEEIVQSMVEHVTAIQSAP